MSIKNCAVNVADLITRIEAIEEAIGTKEPAPPLAAVHGNLDEKSMYHDNMTSVSAAGPFNISVPGMMLLSDVFGKFSAALLQKQIEQTARIIVATTNNYGFLQNAQITASFKKSYILVTIESFNPCVIHSVANYLAGVMGNGHLQRYFTNVLPESGDIEQHLVIDNNLTVSMNIEWHLEMPTFPKKERQHAFRAVGETERNPEFPFTTPLM